MNRPPTADLPIGPALRVESTRGDLVESVHPVHAAVVDAEGRLLASSGDPERLTWWRSAAKPFQALPLVQDGAADAFGLGDEELALACASHSSERMHVDLTERFLAKIGCSEAQLACGPHPPLGAAVAEQVIRSGTSMTPAWSNCSGKHAGMLALAKHMGWPLEGYERAEHPVQRRILGEVRRWSGAEENEVRLSVDGCTAVCFALPLARMAEAYARFSAAHDPSAVRLREAMMRHPAIVAGTRRFCTDLMAAWPGEVLAKIGAEGVYSAALVRPGVGVAVKIEDGDMRSAPIALLAVLRETAARLAPGLGADAALAAVASYGEAPIRNTRGETTGALRAAGALVWHDGAPRDAAPPGAKPVSERSTSGVL